MIRFIIQYFYCTLIIRGPIFLETWLLLERTKKHNLNAPWGLGRLLSMFLVPQERDKLTHYLRQVLTPLFRYRLSLRQSYLFKI